MGRIVQIPSNCHFNYGRSVGKFSEDLGRAHPQILLRLSLLNGVQLSGYITSTS